MLSKTKTKPKTEKKYHKIKYDNKHGGKELTLCEMHIVNTSLDMDN